MTATVGDPGRPARPFDAVLFDMDGVIVDSMPLHREVWVAFARLHGLNPTDDEVRAADGRRAVEVVTLLFGDRLSEADVARLAAEREAYFHAQLAAGEVRAVPGAEAFLRALGQAGVPRVLATSSAAANVAQFLSRLGFADLFEAVVTAKDVTRGKPHPEVYLKAARQVAAAPVRCLVVEDAVAGVQAGKAAGSRCLGLTTSLESGILVAAGADWVAADFTALPPELLA
ncbi:MAG: HAD family phosphatase [Candidatus Sericytochromatia bacterium]|nr:HAD family phosphatase [Candidatus Sericytochromatia bacterium]